MSIGHDSIPFSFDFPVDVFEKSDDGQGFERRIGGIISTEHKDYQDEVVLQNGLDFNYFLKNGWLNDNHSKKTTDIVGYPIAVKKTTHEGKPATYMEGYLIPNYKPSDEIWALAQSLKKTNRKLGFSVEGHVKRREGPNGKIVAKAFVTNVAITNCPFNDKTNLEVLAKSIRAMEQPDFISASLGCMPTGHPNRSTPLTQDEARLFATLFRKAMLAGANPTPGDSIPSPGDASPLIPESLDSGTRNTTYSGKKNSKKEKKKRRNKETYLTKSQALNLIWQRYPHKSLSECLEIFDLIAP